MNLQPFCLDGFYRGSLKTCAPLRQTENPRAAQWAGAWGCVCTQKPQSRQRDFQGKQDEVEHQHVKGSNCLGITALAEQSVNVVHL